MILLAAYLLIGALLVFGILWSKFGVTTSDLFEPMMWVLVLFWPLAMVGRFEKTASAQ
jgi:hypothetical protein